MNPITILRQALVQGTVTSASVAVPSGASKAQVTLLLSAQDAQNQANQLQAALETYHPASGWYTPAYQSWKGGQALTLTFGGWGTPLPSRVRLALDLAGLLSVGATISFS